MGWPDALGASPPFLDLMLGQDPVVHDNGDHQSSDLVHGLAAVGSFGPMMVRLGQAETPFVYKALAALWDFAW